MHLTSCESLITHICETLIKLLVYFVVSMPFSIVKMIFLKCYLVFIRFYISVSQTSEYWASTVESSLRTTTRPPRLAPLLRSWSGSRGFEFRERRAFIVSSYTTVTLTCSSIVLHAYFFASSWVHQYVLKSFGKTSNAGLLMTYWWPVYYSVPYFHWSCDFALIPPSFEIKLFRFDIYVDMSPTLMVVICPCYH